MESLLLGTLSYYGNTINNKVHANTNYNSYNSNIEENIVNIEESQAKILKTQPEYFQQFDSLSFDNLSHPTAENMAHTTRSGFNTFLQRDLDFNNGYSEFQNNDMHYNVIPKEEFVHNNMVPFTSRRENFINVDSNSRKYEQLSGNDSMWQNKKEVDPFFEPVKNMNNVNGLPVMTEQLSQRYNPSLKNNYGNLPFQTDMKVAPGLDGVRSAPYAVHRVMPRNIDSLRSEINKKESYKSKPLETIKKGELRGVESEITSYKLPTYREIDFNDLVPNKYDVEKPKKTGEFVHIETSRGFTDYDNYCTGGMHNSNKGTVQSIDTIKFTPAKRENYLNDFTRGVNAIDTRPVFTNIDSYTNYETDRSEISQELHATGACNTNFASYCNDSSNIAKPTMKQNNIIQNRNLGINGSIEQKSYVFSNDAVLPTTIRQMTNYNGIGNTAPSCQSGPLMLQDEAKRTIKQTTINPHSISNVAPLQQNCHTTLADIAKKTIRETTENNNNIGNISSGFQNINVMRLDEAKPTIKQTTIENNIVLNAKPIYEKGNMMLLDDARHTIKETTINHHGISNIKPAQQNAHITLSDIAKNTIRQTTENNNYISNIASNYKKNNMILLDEAKPTLKESTVINSFIGQATSNVNGVSAYLSDELKPTIKQSTLHSYNGNANYQQGSIYTKNEDEAKPTIRQTTEVNKHMGIIGGNNKELYNSLNDEARLTIKQTTLDTTLKGQNVVANVAQPYIKNNDEAKPTIKETLLHKAPGGRIYNPNEGYYNINDEAKSTIKETLLHEAPAGRMHNVNEGYYNINDDARVTIKQTTLLTNYKGNAKTNVNSIRVEEAERNMCIDDKKQQTALGARIAGAKSDKIRGNINKDTVKFNDKRPVFGYISNPGNSKNYSITPVSRKQTSKKTDLNTNTFYYVDPIQISTLNNNPLVNDIYHQKNVDFNTGN